MTVAGQTAVSYSYDNADRLTGVTQGSASAALGYDHADRRTSLTLANGIVGTSTYDAAGQITAMGYALGQTTVGDLTYTYDLAGSRLSLGGSYARTGLPAVVTSATYDAANQITAWGGTSLTYDSNGNLTSDGSRSYTWNVRNQLTALTGGASASFAYDGLGRRRTRTVSGTARSFLYDGLNLTQELASGTPTANFLTGLNIDEVFRRTDSAGARDLLTDALGSTWALTDTSGTVQTSYTYEPFGATTASGASSTNTGQFTGRENDGTGLYYYRARYYQPQVQRFTAEDPLEFFADEVNLHAYVANEPTNAIDPLGLLSVLPCPSRKSTAGFNLCGPAAVALAIGGLGAGPAIGAAAAAASGARAAAAAARRASRDVKIDGPLGTRIVQVRWNNQPVVRVDYGPIPGSQGTQVLHVHVALGPGGMKTHWPIYPPGAPR